MMTKGKGVQKKSDSLFPYEEFPVRLEHMDGKVFKVCFFKDKDHLTKYIDRAKLKLKQCLVSYKNESCS
jgi:hypothetical protein